MSYRLVIPEDTPEGRNAFAGVATPYLAKHETLNNLQLSVLNAVVTGRYRQAVLVAAEDPNGDLAALLLRTPPFPLLVAHGCRQEARERLLEWLLERDPELPGMVGPRDETTAAVRWWTSRTGRAMRLAMREGVYRLQAVSPARRSPGRAREASGSDRELLTGWLHEFQVEALGSVRRDPVEAWDMYQAGGVPRLYVWEDAEGEVVSLAGRGGRTPTGVRIGPVYTPPVLRGRGFAEALVAAVSQLQLDEGARQCFLYTDLDNGTSNALYERVGYERVGDAVEFRVEGKRGRAVEG